MKGILAPFSPIQLHNRLNRPVWVGFKRVPKNDRELVFLCAGGEGDAQVSKNFETFAGQIVREFRIDPEKVDFVELRCAGEKQEWYRWYARWVGSAPVECRAEPVTGESSRRFLDKALGRSEAA